MGDIDMNTRKRKLNYFSEHRVAFNKELSQHPEIAMAVAVQVIPDSNGQRDEGEVLGTVLSLLGVEIDTVLTPTEMDKVYSSLTHKLRSMRTVSIIH